MSVRQRLILTFDAFGTLFTPRESIAKSYADSARKCGLSGFTDDQIALRFREAFKQESKSNPNYGKESGMDAPQWWSNVCSSSVSLLQLSCEPRCILRLFSLPTRDHALSVLPIYSQSLSLLLIYKLISRSFLFQVIRSTFRPFNTSTSLPNELVPKLLCRFSSSKGYMLYPDVPLTFQLLRKLKQAAQHDSSAIDLSVGIITNSDDRVVSILQSLGLSIGPLKRSMLASDSKPGVHLASENREIADVDFVTLSYDVGVEKPSRGIFDAAKEFGSLGLGRKVEERFMHVGDDLDKDFKGAQQAGWEALLLDREGKHDGRERRNLIISSLLNLESRILPKNPDDGKIIAKAKESQ